MGSKNEIDAVERAVVARLAEEAARQGYSVRAVAQAIGTGKSRVSDLFNGLTSCTVTDLMGLCSLLGLSAAQVVREAEATVAADERERADVVQLGERQRAWSEELPPLEELAAQVEPGADEELAETTGWRDDLGEESQDIPYGEDEPL